jgi:hypothetical protein
VNDITSKQLTPPSDAYNILGWLDEDANKRNQFWRSGQCRDEAPAIALTGRYAF